MTETITSAAIVTFDLRVWSLPSPFRHHHIFALAALLGSEINTHTQGFCTSSGRFVNRKEAMHIARKASQTNSFKPDLYSEDLW